MNERQDRAERDVVRAQLQGLTREATIAYLVTEYGMTRRQARKLVRRLWR